MTPASVGAGLNTVGDCVRSLWSGVFANDLACDRQRLIKRDGALLNAIGKRRPLDQLQHERRQAGGFFKTVDRCDVRMIQGGEDFRFTLKASQAIGIVGKQFRQNLQRHIPAESVVAGAVDLAHPSSPKGGEDFVRAEAGAGLQCHD